MILKPIPHKSLSLQILQLPSFHFVIVLEVQSVSLGTVIALLLLLSLLFRIQSCCCCCCSITFATSLSVLIIADCIVEVLRLPLILLTLSSPALSSVFMREEFLSRNVILNSCVSPQSHITPLVFDQSCKHLLFFLPQPFIKL